MKKSSLLLATAIIASAGLKAEAYDFNDKIYGKANATIGYSLDFLDEEGQEHHWLHNLQFQGGFNTYYKVSDLIHPFVGARIGLNAPLKARERDDGTKIWLMNSLFYFEAVLGAKFNVSKDVAVQPYYFLGYSLIRNTREFNGGSESTNNSRFSTGLGVDGIYNLSNALGLIGGIEYKYICLGKIEGEKIAPSHQIGFHFGVQFL